jgi:hypothetical protein
MEKSQKSFPYCGKNREKFSILWKKRKKVFHTVENPASARAGAVWGWGMVVLAGVFPFAADMFRNFQLFMPAQLAWSFAVVVVGTSAVFWATAAGIRLLRAIARRLGITPAPWLERVAYALAAAVVLAVFLFDSNMTNLRFGFGWSRRGAAAGVAVLFAVYWALAARLGARRTCALLAALIAAGAVRAAWRVSLAADRGDELLSAEEIRIYRNVELTQTPNIYLICLESVHGFQAMEDLYGFDNASFRRFLESRGFEIAGEVFANYSFTMTSLQSLFQMGHHYAAGAFGNHDSLYARGFISGSARYFNPVLNILKRNGYSIVYLLPSDYYYRPGAGLVDHSLLERSWPLAPLKVSLPRFIGREPDTVVPDYVRKVMDAVAGWPPDAPAFFFIKLGAEHTTGSYDYRTDRDGFAARYVRAVQRENPVLEALCRQIMEKDPAGIVILAGDHGAQSYQSQRRTLMEVLEQDDIPADRLVRDIHEVLLAIRWGDGRAPEPFPFRSLANLMRFVFYRLSGDETLMGTEAPDDAYILDRGGLRRTVEGGRPLDEWEWFPRKGWK